MGFKLPKTHKSLFAKLQGKADVFKPAHPVVQKPLGDGIKAEANKDGTTYVSPDVDLNSYDGRLIIAHEEAHHDQFEALWDTKQNKEVDLLGPISPDTCWNSSAKAWREKKAPTHDGILAMYHDQGLIPIKVIALNYSVNTTLGLPFIRTSPDHGTGFDIAGKGLAQSQSMIEAIKTAIDLTKDSRLFHTH